MNNTSSTSTTVTKRTKNRQRRIRKKGKKKKTTSRPRFEKPNMSLPSVRVSQCAKDYARAVLNPFSSFKNLPCIPDFTVVPSSKLQTRIRGSFQTGAQGTGYVLFNPYTAIYNNTAGIGAFVDNPILFTTENYSATDLRYTISGGTPTTIGVQTANSNSPYRSDINSDFQWRLVGAGLRIRYTGSMFRNQGTAYLYTSPANTNIPTNTSASEMMQLNYTVQVPISKKTEYIYYTPKRSTDTYYQGQNDRFPTQSSSLDFIMAIFIEGGDTNTPQTWLFEAVCFYEIVGTGLSLTPSHSDPNGYGAVLSNLPTVNPTEQPDTVLNQVYNKVTDYVGRYTSQLIDQAVPVVFNYGAQRLMSNFSNQQLPTITEL